MPAARIRRITPDEVRKVAELAHLDLAEAEVERLARELGDVLERMEVLETIDVAGVPPSSHPLPLRAPEREDRVVESLDRDNVLAGAPETEDGAFRVPRVVED